MDCGNLIVAYGYLQDIEEWIAQGWTPSTGGPWHPVQARYGRVYYSREDDTE